MTPLRWCKLNFILLTWLCIVLTFAAAALGDLAGWY